MIGGVRRRLGPLLRKIGLERPAPDLEKRFLKTNAKLTEAIGTQHQLIKAAQKAEAKRQKERLQRKAAEKSLLRAAHVAERRDAQVKTLLSLVEVLKERAAKNHLVAEVTALNPRRSLSAGRADWAAKWETCSGRRILFFTISDFSGSFYKWADGINRHTPHAVRMVSLKRHRFGYPVDLLYAPPKELMKHYPDMLNEIMALADEADVIHLKDQLVFASTGSARLPPWLLTQFRKPLVYTLYGGFARRDENENWFRDHVCSFDAVVAMTPDLCFDWCKTHLVPHSIDTETHGFLWEDGDLMLHTPSRPERKGTDFFQAAGNRLTAERGLRCEVVTGVTHQYITEKKRSATIFFDQAGRERPEDGGKLIGWYGNSALEAAVYGVPTIAHLSNEALERAARLGLKTVALNTEPSEEGLYRVMSDFFDRSPTERLALARQTRDWIEAEHSYHATAAKLSAMYEGL